MSDPSAATPSGEGGPRPRYKRRLSNYLIDKKLQLRYVIVITLLSTMIAGTLGFMIYKQQHLSTERIESKLQELTDAADAENITGDYAHEDRVLVATMVGAGVGLMVILSLFLVVMTHKVAGPLFKTSVYFDRMAQGKLGNVSALRQGDMLQDFFTRFKDMHDAVRIRALEDISGMRKAVEGLKASGSKDGKLAEEIAALEAHIAVLEKSTDASRIERPTGAPIDAADQVAKQARLGVVFGTLGLFSLGLVFGAIAIVKAGRVRYLVTRYNVAHEYMHTARTVTILGYTGIVVSIVAGLTLLYTQL